MDRHSTPAFGRFRIRTSFVRLGLAGALVGAAASTTTGQVLVTYSGSSANWNDNANWLGGTPTWTSGTTDLAFPTTASLAVSANAASTNNVSSGTVRNMTFLDGASGYTLSGSAMSLTGTVANAATGTNTINFDMNLTPATNVVWTATTNSTTVFGGSLSGLSGRQLQLVNSGSNATAVHTWVLAGNNSSLSGTIWVASNNAPNGTATGQLLRLGVANDNALGTGRVKLGNQSGLSNMSPTNAALTLSNATLELAVSSTIVPGAGLTFGTILQNVASTQNTGYKRLNIGPGILSTSQISTGGVSTAGLGLGSGTVAITGSSPNFNGMWYQAGGDTIISNAQAFGSGTIGSMGTANSLSATQPLTLPNILAFDNTNDATNARDFGFSGTNSITFDGNIIHLSGGGKSSQMKFNNTGGSVMTFNGSFLATATGTSSVTLTLSGSGNARFNGPITNASGSAGFVQNVTKSGNSTVTFGTANTYSGTTVLNGGLLRLENATALPGGIGLSGGTGWLNMHSTAATAPSVLGLGSGNDNFERALGAGAGQVVITGSGGGAGFAAFGSGAPRNVNLGGAAAAVTWGENNFMSLRTGTFILGHATADGTLDFKNPLATGTGGGTTRTISVAGSAAVDGRLSGVVSGTHSLVIVGGGMLSLTNTNSFTGQMQVNDGGVEVGWMATTGQNSPLGTSGTINLGSGSTAGTFRWVGGDETLGRTLNLAGSTGGGTIDASGTGALTVSSILAGAGAKVLTLAGSSTAANAVGVIPSVSNLDVVKDGPGLWRLTAVSSFGGAFTIKNGTLVAAVNPAGSFGPFGSGQDPTLGDASATSSGTAALLLAAGVTTDRLFKVPATSGSQAVVIGIGESGGTANFTNQIRTSRDVTLIASGSSTVIFDQPWVSFDNTALTRNVTVGAAGYTGTVRINKDLVTSGLVAVPFGDLNLGLTGTIGSGGGPLLIGANGSLSGIGRVTGGIGGAGLVAPGNSPGIATVGSVDPSGGLDFNFEFTGTGSPTYDNAAASVNDVLRITGSTPFTSSLSGSIGNVVNVYLSAGSLVGGEVFRGGFYTDTAADFFSSIQDATFNYWVAGSGTHIYNSGTYVPLATYNSALTMSLSTVPQTTGTFGNGDPLTGQVTQFTVVVPEPSTLALAALGLGLAGFAIAHRRRPAAADWRK